MPSLVDSTPCNFEMLERGIANQVDSDLSLAHASGYLGF